MTTWKRTPGADERIYRHVVKCPICRKPYVKAQMMVKHLQKHSA